MLSKSHRNLPLLFFPMGWNKIGACIWSPIDICWGLTYANTAPFLAFFFSLLTFHKNLILTPLLQSKSVSACVASHHCWKTSGCLPLTWQTSAPSARLLGELLLFSSGPPQSQQASLHATGTYPSQFSSTVTTASWQRMCPQSYCLPGFCGGIRVDIISTLPFSQNMHPITLWTPEIRSKSLPSDFQRY